MNIIVLAKAEFNIHIINGINAVANHKNQLTDNSVFL